MNIHNNSEYFSNSLFYPLKKWAEESPSNYNLLIGLSFVFVMLAVIFFIVITIKIGRKDERTSKISLYSAYTMLMALVVCDIVFPKGYLAETFFMLKYGIACLSGGIYLVSRYLYDIR